MSGKTTEFKQMPAGIKSLLSDNDKDALTKAGFTVGAPAEQPAEETTAVETDPFGEAGITADDKKKFIRSLLARKPFEKEYALFGGAIKVLFATRTTANNKWCVEQSFEKRAKMAKSIVHIKYEGGETRENVAFSEDIILDNWNLFDDDADVLYYAVHQAFDEFEQLCDLLFRNASSPDFWKGTAGRT